MEEHDHPEVKFGPPVSDELMDELHSHLEEKLPKHCRAILIVDAPEKETKAGLHCNTKFRTPRMCRHMGHVVAWICNHVGQRAIDANEPLPDEVIN